jgi:hypothetical protein
MGALLDSNPVKDDNFSEVTFGTNLRISMKLCGFEMLLILSNLFGTQNQASSFLFQ